MTRMNSGNNWQHIQTASLNSFLARHAKQEALDIPGATAPSEFDDRIERCIKAILKLKPASLLDIGCGDGFFLRELRRRNASPLSLSGIDRDVESVNRANLDRFDCRVGQIEDQLPFDGDSFDFVFAGEIIEHVINPDFLLAEIWRVLKPGGKLLLTTPNLLCWYNRILMLIGVTPMYVEHSYYANYGPSYSFAKEVTPAVGHLRIFNFAPLRSVVYQNGFEILSIKGAARLPVRWLWQIDRAISRIRPQLAAQFILLASKSERPPIFRDWD